MSQSIASQHAAASIGSQANESISWIGMTPLELIETLAAETEKREAKAGIFHEPIRINDIVFSSKTPSAGNKSKNGHSATERKAKTGTVSNEPICINDTVLSSKTPSAPVNNAKSKNEHSETLTVETDAKAGTINEPIRIDDTVLLHKTPSAPVNDLDEYVTQWLIANWENPYPNQANLEHMASACGTTKKAINNWLINNRTRRWRPAIVKAYELDRHPSFLLQDSLGFFNGRPVRKHVKQMEAASVEPLSKRTKFQARDGR